jgi:glutamine cyclotransferase
VALAAALACSQPGHEGNGNGSARKSDGGAGQATQGPIDGRSDSSATRAPVHGYEVVARYPHDEKAYTQGLFVQDGVLFESTGRYGTSSVRIVDLATGVVQQRTDLDEGLFGEGIAPYKGLLVMLTWKEKTALVFDRKRLTEQQYRYSFTGEGWGLTFDGTHFWMSDGTTTELRVIDPNGFKELRRVTVTDGGQKIDKLNELEWIDGEIWANVWQTDRIARIDPETGRVKSWVDLKGILGTHRVKDVSDEVLNGIAWDAAQKKVYVTGKHWPSLYEIRVVERPR